MQRISSPSMVLISGDGRNSGKTLLAEAVIRTLSPKHEVTGIKITPHPHRIKTGNDDYLIAHKDYTIFREPDSSSDKDTARMLRAGCSEAWLILARDSYIPVAFETLRPLLHQNAILVCESPVLIHYVLPGIFFFMTSSSPTGNKDKRLPAEPAPIRKNIDDLASPESWLPSLLETWIKKMRSSQRGMDGFK